MGSWSTSVTHTGNKAYQCSGLDSISVPDDATLDITGSITVSMCLKPLPLARLSYTLYTKGHPTTPATGSVSAEAINGYLRVYFHDTNDTNSLVYDSSLPVLKTSKYIHLVVVWDNTAKTLKVYNNKAPVVMVLNTSSGAFYSSPASFTTINTNNDPFVFFKGTGKQNYIGDVLHVYVADIPVSDVEIDALYESTLKYTGVYPSLGDLFFTSTEGGGTNLWKMLEDGTDRSLLILNGTTMRAPSVSHDKQKIAVYFDTTLYTVDSTGGSPVLLRTTSNSQTYPSWTADDSLIWFSPYLYPDFSINNNGVGWIAPDGTGFGVYKSSATPPSVEQGVSYDVGESHGDIALHPDGASFIIAEGSGRANLRRYVINPSTKALLSRSTIEVSSAGGDDQFRFLKFSPSGAYIGYSKRQASSGPYQIWIRSGSGGSPLLVVPSLYATTSSSSAHTKFFLCFSPDETKILFSANDTGVYQIYMCNIDGSHVVNISNNAFNETYADWVAAE